jgi:hypothetical protein
MPLTPENYRRRLANGVCGNCGCRPRRENKVTCEVCYGVVKDRYWKRRNPNCRKRSEIKRRSLEEEKIAHNKASEKHRLANREKVNKASVRCHRERREEIISIYGGKCVCCGESHFEFLQLDHVDGGGAKHRREVGQGYKFLNWLQKMNYPDSIQILCANCNAAKGFYGMCPHKRERIENAECI